MSVDVHLCLIQLKPRKSPNWISAYGKVVQGLDRQEEIMGGRKLNSCLSSFGIPASPEGIKQSELSASSWVMLQSSFCEGVGSPWNCPRAVGGPGDVNPHRCSYIYRLRSGWAGQDACVGASQSCSGTVRKNWQPVLNWDFFQCLDSGIDRNVFNNTTPHTNVCVCLKGSCRGGLVSAVLSMMIGLGCDLEITWWWCLFFFFDRPTFPRRQEFK